MVPQSPMPEAHPLRGRIGSIPKLPGVYLMRAADGEVIYVGKAKSLRERVRSYLSGSDERYQISYLMERVTSLDTIVTETEMQAFVLERDLIAKYKPRYNVRLKDDKAFLSIRIDTASAWPRLQLVRKVEDDGALYFGPYSFSYELRNLLDIVKRVVPLRTCSDTVFFNRQRPCLEYQIKRCAGPCCLPVERADYMRWVKQAIAILEGRTAGLVKEYTAAMEHASRELQFEEAAVYRDRIATLESAKVNQSLVSPGLDDRDVFGIHREEGLAAISVMRVRSGRIGETVNFALSEVRIPDTELLESAIVQFYDGGRETPEDIVLPGAVSSPDMLAQVLSEKCGHAVAVSQPQRGVRHRLLQLACLNARQHFVASFEADRRGVEISKELAKTLELAQVPRRIECVDISNLQGSDIVGAVVVFMDGVPEKRSYKKYKISFQSKPDDFAAIHEVVSRRLRRAARDGDAPDLLIIDGGPNQLLRALKARDELGLQLEIVALAKMRSAVNPLTARARRACGKAQAAKPERLYREGIPEPILLDGAHAVTHFLQRIRDEVHRFVITYHRARRSARAFMSVIDSVPGIGPERKRRLLRAFGSLARMRGVSPQELSKVGRMPLMLAERLAHALEEER